MCYYTWGVVWACKTFTTNNNNDNPHSPQCSCFPIALCCLLSFTARLLGGAILLCATALIIDRWYTQWSLGAALKHLSARQRRLLGLPMDLGAGKDTASSRSSGSFDDDASQRGTDGDTNGVGGSGATSRSGSQGSKGGSSSSSKGAGSDSGRSNSRQAWAGLAAAGSRWRGAGPGPLAQLGADERFAGGGAGGGAGAGAGGLNAPRYPGAGYHRIMPASHHAQYGTPPPGARFR